MASTGISDVNELGVNWDWLKKPQLLSATEQNIPSRN